MLKAALAKALGVARFGCVVVTHDQNVLPPI